MALTAVATGDTVQAADVNQFKNHMEGAATGTYLFKPATATSFQIQLVEAAGATYFRILDSAGVEVFSVDSNGVVVAAGSVTGTGGLVLPLSASPTVTAEGAVQWDTDDNRLVIGDGATNQTFYPGDHSATAAGLLKYKYKTAGQNFTTTTLENVLATSGNIAFVLAASTAYKLEIEMYISAVGTAGSGGFKWALSGITAPTAFLGTLYVTATLVNNTTGEFINPQNSALINPGSLGMSALTMGSAFGGLNSFNTGAAGLSVGLYKITAFILTNTAGTVTLQAAQNTAAGISTIASAVATLTKLTAE